MQDTITKKELLEITGISYGSLYRWKRMGLIPTEWFGRISTFTGQETVFPRAQMLQRVQQIQQMKDTLSLEEMAAVFAPAAPGQATYTPAQLVQAGVLGAPALQVYGAARPLPAQLDGTQAQVLWAFGQLLAQVGRDMAFALCDLLLQRGDVQACRLVVLRRLGVDVALCLPLQGECTWAQDAQPVLDLPGTQIAHQCDLCLQAWKKAAR